MAAAPGRYVVTLVGGGTAVISGTSDEMLLLYKNLVDPTTSLLRTYTGFAWIAPPDYANRPVTRVIGDLLPSIVSPALGG